MKRILTIAFIAAGASMLAGCTRVGSSPSTSDTGGVVEVHMNADNTGDAKQECLTDNFQWNDAKQICERPDAKSMCLTAANQWNDKTESCEFSKDNCLSAGHQWNEQTASCEFTKEECLSMGAQWDDQATTCERQPVTEQNDINDCLDQNGQRDYASHSCQMHNGDNTSSAMQADNSGASQ